MGAIPRVTAPGAAGELWSWLERELARVLREAGIDSPTWNAVVRDDRGRIAIVDALWPEHRLVVEADGLAFHRLLRHRRRDRAALNRLALAGSLVLRYSWLGVVTRPDDVVQQVRAAVAARAAGVLPSVATNRHL